MKLLLRAAAAVLAGGALTAGLAGAAGAAPLARHVPDRHFTAGAVFVQNDALTGNQVVAYDRAPDGTLTEAGVYDTGGLGGQLAGSAVDHLASQGSLARSDDGRTLYAVDAGSDTVSVFAVQGDRLALRQVVGSGGEFPVSIAVRGGLVYVLNALGGGSLQGFVAAGSRLVPLPGSQRALGLDPNATPQFTHTPGQVAFAPDGHHLVVTTKANGSDIDVFAVNPSGRLSAAPVVNAEPGTVPFAISYDPRGHLVIAEAGTNALSTWTLNPDGTVTLIDRAPAGQAATCWVVGIGNRFYASNAASATLSGYQDDGAGGLALLGNTATDAGTVDAAAAPGGQFLYVQAGARGIVDELLVGPGGDLVCRQAVELVTDYLEGALSRRQRRRLEAHLAVCEHCAEYLAQVRATIRATGRVVPDDLLPETRDGLVDLYRRWRGEAPEPPGPAPVPGPGPGPEGGEG